EQPIRRRRRHHDQIQLARLHVRTLHGDPGGSGPHLRRAHLAAGDATLPDPGALPDPLVRGVDEPFEILVRHHPLGQVTTGAYDFNQRRRLPHAPSANRPTVGSTGPPPFIGGTVNSRLMCPTMSVSTARIATRIAFLIARGGEPPWQMIESP